jgi:hypothetical protein
MNIHHTTCPFLYAGRQDLLAAQKRVCSALSRNAEQRLFPRAPPSGGVRRGGRVLFGTGLRPSFPQRSAWISVFSCQFASTLPGLASSSIWDVLPATKSHSMYFETGASDRHRRTEFAVWLAAFRTAARAALRSLFFPSSRRPRRTPFRSREPSPLPSVFLRLFRLYAAGGVYVGRGATRSGDPSTPDTGAL